MDHGRDRYGEGFVKTDVNEYSYNQRMGGDNEITQEDAWAVIKGYFEQHGLVSQQISSFDRFLSYTVQDIVTENSVVSIIPEKQYAPGGKCLSA
jgi:DNA-directed RNA polymerase II subunit RPB2